MTLREKEATEAATMSSAADHGTGTAPADLVCGQLSRFVRRGSVRAGVVGDAESERAAVGDAGELDALRQLLLLLDTPSRLDIETDLGRYHLVFTGILDVAVSCGAEDEDVDTWLDQITRTYRTEVTR